ncbi:MAG TPA: hypothetical protein VK822_01690 [Acetobacteraceae bacterium]|jgi:hypothetical protein|nr:hypothetical protein [Acetobacteraceae bacterium]
MTKPALSLSPTFTFHWLLRLRQEACSKNLTELHHRIATRVQKLLEAGDDQFSHEDVATGIACARTVGDALRRLRGLGMLDWEPQYNIVAGRRRRTVNRYWLCMPSTSPCPRPDLRRRGQRTVCRASISKEEAALQKGAVVREPSRESAQMALQQVRALMEQRLMLRLGHRESGPTHIF